MEEKKGKNLVLWIVSAVSLLLSVVLLVVVLCGGNGDNDVRETNPKTVAKNKTLSSGGLKVAYINTDSVLAKYQMARDMEESLKAYQQSLENELQSKASKLKSDYENYMKNGSNLTLTQQKQTEQDLTQRQQNLPAQQQQMLTNLQERQMADNKKLLDAIYAFIRDYNSKHQNFDIILSKSYMASPVLYIDEGMDITDEIIEGLNKEYKEYKKDN